MVARSVVDETHVIRVQGALSADAALRLRDKVTWALRHCASVEVDLSAVDTTDEVGRNLLALLSSIASPMLRIIPPVTSGGSLPVEIRGRS